MNNPFQPTQQEYKPPSHIACKWCDLPIYVGDRSVYIHHGSLGRGGKSGQPVVTDAEATSGDAVVHELCAISYMTTSVVDSTDELEAVIDSITDDIFGISFSEVLEHQNYCAACEAKIEDKDE